MKTRHHAGPTDYDLVATGDRNGDGVARLWHQPRCGALQRSLHLVRPPLRTDHQPRRMSPMRNRPTPTPGGAAAPYRAVSLNPPTEDGRARRMGHRGGGGHHSRPRQLGRLPTGIRGRSERRIGQLGRRRVFIVLPPAASATVSGSTWTATASRTWVNRAWQNVPVTLRDGAGNMVAATTTGADGLYGFDHLVTSMRLEFGPVPYGYVLGPAHGTGPEGDAGDSDADPVTGMTPVTPGPRRSGSHLGRRAGASASGHRHQLPDLQQVAPGGAATFTIVVHNVGELDLVDVTVTDPLAHRLRRAVGDLAVGASTTYTCTVPGVLVDFTSVATVTGKDRFGEEVTDDDDAVVDVLPVIDVTKLATPDIVNTDGVWSPLR
ncbi:MAG: hypothetical protein R2838_05420 [Caldilineaceae bacterium]